MHLDGQGFRILNFLLDSRICGSQHIFQGAYSIRLLLQTNDIILDKAFRNDCGFEIPHTRFVPQRLYGGWPPPVPGHLRLAVNIFAEA